MCVCVCVCVCDLSTFISRILISGAITPGSISWKRISVLPVKEAVHVFCVSEKPVGALIPPQKLRTPQWGCWVCFAGGYMPPPYSAPPPEGSEGRRCCYEDHWVVLVPSLILSPHSGPPHMSRVSMKGSGDASDLTDASELWGCEAEAQSSRFQTTEGGAYVIHLCFYSPRLTARHLGLGDCLWNRCGSREGRREGGGVHSPPWSGNHFQ